MNRYLSSYLRTFDTAAFITQAARGYVRTKCTTAQFGPFPVIRGKVMIHVRGEAVFGQRFTAQGDRMPTQILVADGARLTVGDYTAMNCGTFIEVWHDVRIGNLVMLAPNVTILDDNRHLVEPGTPLYKGPTIIGDNVWVGTNCTILPGATIGAGSVIAGHSVVSGNIPPNSFAAGSPARVIKSLNIPDGWSHRFGYERGEPAPGVWASLRRAFGGDPNATIAGTDPAERDHQAPSDQGSLATKDL